MYNASIVSYALISDVNTKVTTDALLNNNLNNNTVVFLRLLKVILVLM